MSYIPHTPDEIKQMLSTIGVDNIEDLFAEIPKELRCDLHSEALTALTPRLSEMEIAQLMRQRAEQNGKTYCFIGAGAYDHYIPAAVWELTTRGEFYSAYTPYQAEASQGTLQLLYEFQSMISGLTGMEAANASLYDGASALAEAVLMAVRLRKNKAQKILIPKTVHPIYRSVLYSLTAAQGIEYIELNYDATSGVTDLTQLPSTTDGVAALIIPQPNFFGQLEWVDDLARWAQQRDLLVIALVNPLSLAVLKPPGEWGESGADMVCGEGQPLGIPMSGGGPCFGFMSCKKAHVRQMPGRIVGRTVDLDGNTGYTLTLQAREQHIRRAKATSNICTNQGLMVTAASIYLSLLGPAGLAETARACHRNTSLLLEELSHISGIRPVFNHPYFHEVVVRIEHSQSVADILTSLANLHILGGYDLSQTYPELGPCLLICATEMRTVADIEHYAANLRSILTQSSTIGLPL
ncbi:aminomethyl-transferring glycine dehydrogenase subunit GcvPA [Thioflexithrix psekupsensis]|uniref:Probable glycine dehydrogenase (decarboxylating) subunit 1 n=1 Tax=Thioflexithrix psekupsensis TaxID=1570016 RepID=A0A251XC44_9GAMM|nr:aminomethyl-transferring glycine dehydrogenase subunit GcvPA [Thioflexithrix psekupsensis]OUD16173.1 glycine dehydrogenase (aminomethyl-transferring) [Thioflexithrix psekupsensis]